MIDEIVKPTEIPAPPFKEAARAAAYRDMLTNAGLEDVEIDEEGNAMGVYRGTGPRRRSGGDDCRAPRHRLSRRHTGQGPPRRHAPPCPGIAATTRSLAVLLAYVRAMKESGIKVKQDIIFVGNVGEEGPGDLRGVRYLLTRGNTRTG